jgi:hypothetical protein
MRQSRSHQRIKAMKSQKIQKNEQKEGKRFFGTHKAYILDQQYDLSHSMFFDFQDITAPEVNEGDRIGSGVCFGVSGG